MADGPSATADREGISAEDFAGRIGKVGKCRGRDSSRCMQRERRCTTQSWRSTCARNDPRSWSWVISSANRLIVSRRAPSLALRTSREISPVAGGSHWNGAGKIERDRVRDTSTRIALHEVDSGIRLNSSAMNKSGKNPNVR